MNILMIDTSGPACGVPSWRTDGWFMRRSYAKADAQPARHADGGCGAANERYDD